MFISEHTGTKSLCVTKGKHGSVLLWKETFYYNYGFPIKVIDTVGAGDSFLAALISKLLCNDDPQEAIDFGGLLGSMVARCEGANPEFSAKDIESFSSAHGN